MGDQQEGGVNGQAVGKDGDFFVEKEHSLCCGHCMISYTHRKIGNSFIAKLIAISMIAIMQIHPTASHQKQVNLK